MTEKRRCYIRGEYNGTPVYYRNEGWVSFFASRGLYTSRMRAAQQVTYINLRQRQLDANDKITDIEIVEEGV